MEKFNFKNRIQSNPRLLRLKNPITGQIIDYEIQDLQESEIVENGTEMTAEVLNQMQSNIEESCVAVSPTHPETNERVWIDNENNIIKTKNDDGTFKTIYDEKKLTNEIGKTKWQGTLAPGESIKIDVSSTYGFLAVRCMASMMEVYRLYGLMGANAYAYTIQEILTHNYTAGGNASISVTGEAPSIILTITNTGTTNIDYLVCKMNVF